MGRKVFIRLTIQDSENGMSHVRLVRQSLGEQMLILNEAVHKDGLADRIPGLLNVAEEIARERSFGTDVLPPT